MKSNRNLKQFQVYLRPKQIESLNKLRSQIKIDCNVKFPLAELIRDALNQFILETTEEEVRKIYLENKGW